MTAPFGAAWTGGAWEVLRRDRARADTEMVVGQRYIIEPVEERSAKAHRFYFAAVNEAWLNLPEDKAQQYPTPTHLRKWALIRAGYRDERTFVASTKAEALRIAAFVRPTDDYAVVTVRDATVTVYTAKSQSLKAMGKTDFQNSKEAVLQLLSEMIGVAAGELQKAGANA